MYQILPIRHLARFLFSQRAHSQSGPSRYNGVDFYCKKWRAQASLGGKTVYLGRYERDEDAARAFDFALREAGASRHRLRRSLNFPTNKEREFKHQELIVENSVRKQNVLRYGLNYETEARALKVLIDLASKTGAAKQFQFCWRLGEGTRADCIFRPVSSVVTSHQWKALQVKATMASRNILFQHTSGYDGLLIICFALIQGQLWAIPGRALNHKETLYIPLGQGQWAQYAFDCESLPHVLWTVWFDDTKYVLRSQYEWETFGLTKEQLIARSAHVQSRLLLERVGFSVSLPLVEHSSTDMVINESVNVQEKARTKASSRSGSFCVDLTKRSGLGTVAPYEHTDFDLLLTYLWRFEEHDAFEGFFAFPMHTLLTHCTDDGTRLRKSLMLYPPWSLPANAKAKISKLWQFHFWFDADFDHAALEAWRLHAIVDSSVQADR